MTTAGCLNLRGKDGSQSSITVRYFYLSAPSFNACTSYSLRTECLFFQRPFASQMGSPVFSHFAAFLLGAFLVLGINCFFWSSGRDDLTSPFNLLLVLICLFGLAICCLKHGSCSETQSKKNSIESSCKFPPEQKYPHALIFVSRVYPAGNQFQTANRENEL